MGQSSQKYNSLDELRVKQELHAQPSSSQVGLQGLPDALVLYRSLVTPWRLQVGSVRTGEKKKLSQGQTAPANSGRGACSGGRQSSEDVQESSSESLVRRAVGQTRGRETSLASSTCLARGTFACADGQSLCTSARQFDLAGSRPKSSHVEDLCPSFPRLLLVAHSDARGVLPKLPGALRGLPQSTRFGAVQQRSSEECESYFHFPPRSDGYQPTQNDYSYRSFFGRS